MTTQLSGNSYTIVAPGNVVSKNVEMLNDGTSIAVVTYDEGTIIKTTLSTDGNVHLDINKSVTINDSEKTIEIDKGQ